MSLEDNYDINSEWGNFSGDTIADTNMSNVRKIRIVKTFKIKKKKNINVEILEKDNTTNEHLEESNTIKDNKELSITNEHKNTINVEIIPKINKELDSKSGQFFESESVSNSNNTILEPDDIVGDHYIGLLFTNCISVNKLHNMGWEKLSHKRDTIYLNITRLYVKDSNKFPIIRLDNDILGNNFKYKKYIKDYIKKTYSISKKNVLGIKLFETYGNLHNYIVILDNYTCLDNGRLDFNTAFTKEVYSWRSRLDFYNIGDDISLPPSQNTIYKLILSNKRWNTASFNDFKLIPFITDDVPKYIFRNEINYIKLLELLKKYDFKY